MEHCLCTQIKIGTLLLRAQQGKGSSISPGGQLQAGVASWMQHPLVVQIHSHRSHDTPD